MHFTEEQLLDLFPEFYKIDISEPINWKNKPTGKITFLLEETEYKNKELTNLLKNIVIALKVPFENVSFGMIKRGFREENLKQMQTPIGLIFGKFLFPWKEKVIIDGKEIYSVASLMEMTVNKKNKKIAWDLMQTFLDKIN